MKALAGGAQPAPAPVKMPDPIRIPTQQDPDMRTAIKQQTEDEFKRRRGRASTDLSSGGGSSYSRTTLG